MEDHPLHGGTVTASHPHSHPQHHYHHHHHHHIKKHRLPSGKDDAEEEELDPRIQVELERLNKASEEINKLELELDDARAGFRQVLSDSTQCLNGLAKKLGNCVDKARPYYDSRMKLKEAHVESQRAALRFERACSMHEAAKEMVQLAEEGYKRREEDLDPTWQEMLNHATMKVNEAEKERIESESNHQYTTINFKKKEDDVQKLQKDLKRSITKSSVGFHPQEQKGIVSRLEESVSQAKALYSQALRNLEAISDDIHRTRLERRQNRELGERGAGVGAEAPSPPPSWDKGINIEGSASSCAFDSDGDDDSQQHSSHSKKVDRGIVRHEAAHRNRSSVSEALIESASLEPDPLNVVMFKTESPQSSSPQRSPANFQPPSVINPYPDRARTASYRAAVDRSVGSRSEVEDGEESQDITPTLESVGKCSSLAISSLPQEGADTPGFPAYRGCHDATTPLNSGAQHSPAADLSVRESSLSRAQEWVNRSPVPQQRRFVKSQSLINASAASSSLGSLSSPPEEDTKVKREDEQLSSSLTTTALKSMRGDQTSQQISYMDRTLSSPPELHSDTPSIMPTYQRLHSAPVSSGLVSQQMKSSSLGSTGSVRSLSSTPPDDRVSRTSPLSHRKSPKLQGLILKVDASCGSSSSMVKSAGSVRSQVSSEGQQTYTATAMQGQDQVSSSGLPRVVISTQHPTLGVFTEQVEHAPSASQQHNVGTADNAGNTQPPLLSSLSSSSSAATATSQLPSSATAAPVYQKPPSVPRHPTSLITQQLNKMMHAVAEVSASAASASPFKVGAYNSKTAPAATLMGNSYRLPSGAASTKAHPQVSPLANPPTPLSPMCNERSLAVTPGGRSDSLSTVGSSSLHSRSVHLKPPSDSSDTESIASTGPMLDDDQVELINMDFTEQSIANSEEPDCSEDYDYPPIDPNLANPRGHWTRMSLPPRLNYLEGFLERARKLSGEQKTPEEGQSPSKAVTVAADEEGGSLECCEVSDKDSSLKKTDGDDEVNDDPFDQALEAGCVVSGLDAVTATECVGNEAGNSIALSMQETCNVSTKVEATVVISPDEGISVIEGSNDFTEHEEQDTEELVTKEDHYL
ncbi:SH3 domain-binding protein 5-like protein [Elysia marginata]|uniref:SH3 domain-binding protein 5-like protein n=1 Tax=Elysia marginata TaxID=1093978 RepID=A0AAV4FGZ5_9GAST|nr:SH3 domain-binding protein 5-like protein [Elysia marginata]